MTEDVLTITPGRTLRDAAKFMTENKVGAAVIMDPEQPGPGIITERDLVRSLGAGENPDNEYVKDHLTSNGTFAGGDWSLIEAADAMAKGGFRHLVVVEGGEMAGIISMRDIIHVWGPESGRREEPGRNRHRGSQRNRARDRRAAERRRGRRPGSGPRARR